MTTSPPLTGPADTARHAPTLRTIATVSIAALFVVGQLYAVLPMIDTLTAEFGVSAENATWLSTAFGLAYAIGMLVAGPLSDALGRRRVAVAGLVAGAVGALLIPLAPSFTALIIARVVQGATAAFFPPVALAYLTERIAPRHRSAALTTVISSFLTASIVAPLAAETLSAVAGWRTWFVVSAVVLAALALLTRRVMLPEEGTHREAPTRVIGRALVGLPKLLGRKRLVALYVTTTTLMFTFVGIPTLVQLAGPGTAGHPDVMQVVRLATLPACLIVPLAAHALARIPAARRLVGATLLTALATAVTGIVGGPVGLAVSLGVVTLGVATAAPALVETIGVVSPARQRGGATAVYGSTLFVGASLAAPAAALTDAPYLVTAVGFAVVMAVGSASALFGSRTQGPLA